MADKGLTRPETADTAETGISARDHLTRDKDRIAVQISKDGLTALVAVFQPPEGSPPVTLEEARERLSRAGVVYGIDEAALSRVVASRSGTFEPVAFGKEPVPGLDGQIEYHFQTNLSQVKPSELADGRVDYYNLNLVQNVDAGQVLAVRTPPGEGIPGKKVTGEEIRTQPGREARLFAGKNTRWNDEGTVLLATAQGHVTLKGDKVEVHTVYEQDGDVDFSSGNLDCLGSVRIKGSVNVGFTVRAAGDVEIFGTVNGGTVIAGRNVQVCKGILGHGNSRVTAEGSVIARFIENSRVEAGENVVADAIMHSQVFAGGNIIVEGKKGLIVGGVVRAGGDVMAKTIGSYLTTPTIVECGVRPELYTIYTETTALLAERKTNLDKVEKAVKLLEKLEKVAGELPEEKRVMLNRLRETMVHLNQEIKSLEEKLILTEAELTAGKGRVGVSGSIYPGVTVTIGRLNHPIREERRFSILCIDHGEIRTYPYR